MRILRLAAIVPLGLTAALAAGQCWAELLARRGQEERAVAFERSRWMLRAVNPRHLERQAERGGALDLDAAGEALKVHPGASALRIRLGIEQERAGQWAAAEQSLLGAARLDRQHAPAWTLANFYFRAGDRKRFWQWARQAAARTYDGYRPLLRLADVFETNPRALLDRLGEGAPLTRAYLDFLIGERRLSDAQDAARALLAYGDAADFARIGTLIDRQIQAGNADAAVELWHARFPPHDQRRRIVRGRDLGSATAAGRQMGSFAKPAP